MNAYRHTAMVVITCAAGLSLTACTVGITTAKPAPTASDTGSSPIASHAGASPTAPSSHPASPRPSAVTMIPVNAPIHGFPVPGGTQVAYNVSCPKLISITVTPVTPAQSSAFYTLELPRAGYKIQSNMMMADPTSGAADGLLGISFTGHGYEGSLFTMANPGAEASADPSIGTLPSDMPKNVLEITLTASGTPDSYICPGI